LAILPKVNCVKFNLKIEMLPLYLWLKLNCLIIFIASGKRPSLQNCLLIGRALLELGRAENLLDEKRRKKSQDYDFRSSANPSAETTLLRLLVSPDDVSFDGLSIEDFGVSILKNVFD
jgi:hypothetical protein